MSQWYRTLYHLTFVTTNYLQDRHLLTSTKVTNTESPIWCGIFEDKWERLIESLDA
jgi:hypothetical protein